MQFNAEIQHDKTLNILFDKIISESRCPTEVDCLWPGEVTVGLSLTDRNGMAVGIRLSDHPDKPELRDTAVAGYLLTLLEVLPYPDGVGTIDSNAYQIRVLIEDE